MGAGDKCGAALCMAAVHHGRAAGEAGLERDGFRICSHGGGEERAVELLQVTPLH